MKDELKEFLDEVELEIECDCCNVSGRAVRESAADSPFCFKCNGAGFVPTLFGKKILNLMNHNIKREILNDR